MIRYILLFLLGYFLIRFIFGFVIPVYKTTKQVKKQFADMQQKVQEPFNGQTKQPAEPVKEEQKPQKKEYLDFEEVKG
jgi:hypothetical protein